MIIYKLEDIMKTKGISWYRLLKENIISKPTKDNFKKGGDLSMKKLDELCNFLDCSLSDIIEYVKDGSHMANWYTAKVCIENADFNDKFTDICNTALDNRTGIILERLAIKYEDSTNKESVKDTMMEVLSMDKKIYDFNELISSANKVKEFERISYLEKIREAFMDLNYDANMHYANGSLSKLCNLNDSFCWAEYLDVYLDDWRKEHNQEDEDGNIIGTDYYDVTGYEIVEKLTEKEFLELVDTLKDSFEYEVEEYQNLFE